MTPFGRRPLPLGLERSRSADVSIPIAQGCAKWKLAL